MENRNGSISRRSTLRSTGPPLKAPRVGRGGSDVDDENCPQLSSGMSTERGAVGRGRMRGRKRGNRGRGKGRVTRMRRSSMNDSSSDSDVVNDGNMAEMDSRTVSDVIEGSAEHSATVPELNSSGNEIGNVERERVDDFRKLEEEVRQLNADKSRLSVLMNEYKVSANERAREVLNKEVLIKALQAEVMRVDKINIELKGTVHSIQKLNQELLKKMSDNNKSRGKYVDRMMKQVPAKYLGIALAVDQMMQKWCCKETCELDPNADRNVRLWTNRAEVVLQNGIKMQDGSMIVPTPYTFLCNGNNIYVPSINTEKDIICSLLRTELSSGESLQIYPCEPSRNAVVEEFYKIGTLESRLKQLLSDFCSGRKRAAKDRFFEVLGYSSLLSRVNLKDVGASERKETEISVAKNKLLKSNRNGEIDMSWWRTANILEIQKRDVDNRAAHIVESHDDDDEMLVLFKNEIGPAVLHDFIGYVPQDGEGDIVEGTIMSIPRVDAWINSCVKLLMVKDYRGGGRQKEFNKMFSKYVKVATDQLIGKIRKFVEEWAPEELEVPECDVGEEEQSFREMEREATIVVTTSSPKKHFIAVKSKWFCQYIGVECGIIHDCYIAEISSDWKSVDKLGNPYLEGDIGSSILEYRGTIEDNESVQENIDAVMS